VYDVLCQIDVVQQMTLEKTSTIQKMLDQVTQEYEVSIVIIIIIITTCYGATQLMLSSALQQCSLYNTV